jgi:hypothetical protein
MDASTFRGSDETLDREIATLEAIVRLRIRRLNAELREIDGELRELRRERARRRASPRSWESGSTDASTATYLET